jgi:hypothetical protein
MKRLGLCAVTLVAACFGQSAATPTPNASDQKEILRRAPLAYYSLKRAGLKDFRCQLTPDWDYIYKTLKTDAVGQDQLLPILKSMRFQVAVGPDGTAAVSHESDAAPPNEAVAARIRQTTDGVEKIVTGFFQTWSQFMVNSVFPDPDSAYRMQSMGDKLVITQQDGKTVSVVSMNRDLVIDTIRATTPEFEGTIDPTFAQHKDGLIVTSYEATYKDTASGNSRRISVAVDYSDVEGLTLPHTVKAEVSAKDAPIEIPLTFSDCQVKTQ